MPSQSAGKRMTLRVAAVPDAWGSQVRYQGLFAVAHLGPGSNQGRASRDLFLGQTERRHAELRPRRRPSNGEPPPLSDSAGSANEMAIEDGWSEAGMPRCGAEYVRELRAAVCAGSRQGRVKEEKGNAALRPSAALDLGPAYPG